MSFNPTFIRIIHKIIFNTGTMLFPYTEKFFALFENSAKFSGV